MVCNLVTLIRYEIGCNAGLGDEYDDYRVGDGK